MRFALAALVAWAGIARGQTKAAPVALIVRSTLPEAVLTVNFVSTGPGYALSVFNGAPGWVKSDGKAGTGSTPTIITLDTKPGTVRIFVLGGDVAIRVAAFNDTTRKDLVAVGRSIDAVRDTLGNLTLIPTKRP